MALNTLPGIELLEEDWEELYPGAELPAGGAPPSCHGFEQVDHLVSGF
jgi:hypothetical protein